MSAKNGKLCLQQWTARKIDRNDTRGEWIMDFSLARMCFRLSIDIITENSRAAGTSNDMKRTLRNVEHKKSSEREHKSPFNHNFFLPPI